MRPRTYLHAFIHTFSSLRYYLTVLNSTFSFSLRFLFISYLFLGLAVYAVFYTRELPRLEREVEQSIQEFERAYPEHLRIEWDGETLRSSSLTPIEVPYPAYFPRSEESPSTLAYLDTQVKERQEIFSRVPKSSLLFVTSKELLLSSIGIGWEAFPLKDVPLFDTPFVITKEKLPELLTQARTVVASSFSLMKILLPAVVLPLFMLWRIFIVLTDSIIIYYLIRFMAVSPLPYLKVVQLSFHVLVVAETANLITFWLLPQFSFPLFNIIFYIFLTLLLLHLRNIRAIQVKSHHEEQE